MIKIAPDTTVANLRQSVALEMMANRRFMNYAQQAEKEAYHRIAALFKMLAEHHSRHAQRHLDELERIDRKLTPSGGFSTAYNIRATLIGGLWHSTRSYPEMAREAENEDLTDIADWFKEVAKASQANIQLFREILREFT